MARSTKRVDTSSTGGTPRHRPLVAPSFAMTSNGHTSPIAAPAASSSPTAVSGHGCSAAGGSPSITTSPPAALGLRPVPTRQVPSFASSTTNSRINNNFNTAAMYASSAGSNSSSGGSTGGGGGGGGRYSGTVLGGSAIAGAHRVSPATAAGLAAIRRADEISSTAATAPPTTISRSGSSNSIVQSGMQGRCASPRFSFSGGENYNNTGNGLSSRLTTARFSVMPDGTSLPSYRDQFRNAPPQRLSADDLLNTAAATSSPARCDHEAVQPRDHQQHSSLLQPQLADRLPLHDSITSGLLNNNNTTGTGHDAELAAELDDMILAPLLASWSATTGAANNQNATSIHSKQNTGASSDLLLCNRLLSENINGMSLGQQVTKKPAKGLAADLISFVQKQLERDVRVMCDNKTFSINSVILSARSPVFHRMLQSEFVEGKSKVIKITDTNPYVVENFVDALTCDSCAILRDTRSDLTLLVQLYLLSDRYEFTSLTKRCESRLCGLMRKETALEVLDAAELTQSTMLKRRCMEMLQRYRGAELLSILRGQDLWSQLRDMRVTIETNYIGVANGGCPRKAEVTCCDHDTIAAVKRLVSGVWPIRVECQRLIFQGKLLEDERTVCECGIQAGCVIFVMELSTRRMGKYLHKTAHASSSSPTANSNTGPAPNSSTGIANSVNASVEPRRLTLRNHRICLGNEMTAASANNQEDEPPSDSNTRVAVEGAMVGSDTEEDSSY